MSELKNFIKILPRKQFNILADSHIQFTGHIQQLLDSRPVKVALNWMPQGGRRPRVRPKMKSDKVELEEQVGSNGRCCCSINF